MSAVMLLLVPTGGGGLLEVAIVSSVDDSPLG